MYNPIDDPQLTPLTGDAPSREINLKPYVDVLWQYRRVIVALLVAAAVLYVVGVLAALAITPAERIASLQFRLLFDGADQNEYPNGTPFSPNEIVAAPILTEVYRMDGLDRYGPYDSFKDSIFVLQSNPAVEMLTFEYEAKLSDTRLTPVDRARIEDEFRRKREALKDPIYSLNLRREERLVRIPADLMQKVLNDTLSTWAAQAAERKGATRYNVPVLSSKILDRKELAQQDYLIATDILRSKAKRVLDTIDQISKLPGAYVMRTAKDNISLAEIRANLQDIVRFQLEPLLELVRSEAVTRNPRELTLYATNQAVQLRLDQERQQALVTSLRDALDNYMAERTGRVNAPARSNTDAASGGTATIMPQLDQSFLNQLMTLSTAGSDQTYRQHLTDRIIEENERLVSLQRESAFYETLTKNISAGGTHRVEDGELAKRITTRLNQAFDGVSTAVQQLMDLHQELSKRNLNPSVTLYAVTSPFFVSTKYGLPLGTLVLYFALIMLMTLIVAPLACLAHSVARQRDTRAVKKASAAGV